MVITRVVDGSMAQQCGLKADDVVTHINGMPATDANLTKAQQQAGYGGDSS